MRSLLRSASRSVVRPIRRWILALSCWLTGHQHALFVYWWYCRRTSVRDKAFNEAGTRLFQPFSADRWREFRAAVQEEFELRGLSNVSYVDWAEDKRISIDCHKEPISGFVKAFYESEEFQNTMNGIFQKAPWKIVFFQIYRTYPEGYAGTRKEINSTYYHVDNGGHIPDRLLVSVFLYLSDVTHGNGPFTFYNPQQTALINRHFIGEIFKLGNLRTLDLVSSIESFMAPHELTLEPGQAAVMDNQVCLHRAGFCTEGHRDILQMHVRG